MSRAARWPRRVLLFGLGLFIAVACTPDYDFVDDPTAEHCSNGITDLDETDTDCGGGVCKACGLGDECVETSDCDEGQCIDGFCQAASCDNGAQDEGETGIDCGGMCKPCQAGDPCDIPADCASLVCTDGVCVAPSCEDGIINGTETGRDCGGGLCDGCGTGSPCNDVVDCKSGVCEGEEGTKKCEVSCVEGTAECDGVTTELSDECETNILTDAMHCGDCGTVCELAHAEQSCVSGRCQIASCTSPYDDCNNDAEDGCETNLRSAAGDCGACGNECSDQNGTPSCVNRECVIECDAGFFDCNDSRLDGCEQNIASDVLNCDGCGNECPYRDGYTPFCRDGVCGETMCDPGRGNCDGRGEDCEKDLTNDVLNCEHCGGQCTVYKGTPKCDDIGCGVESCEDGWGNCNAADPDGGYMNGCETNTNVDPMNCGACGRVCTTLHGTGTCVAGECRVMGCDDGWTNCDEGNSDGGFANGCETNTGGDKTNCGVCGRNCDTVLASANATGRCVGGLCQRDQCLANFGDCDTNANNCESDFRTDEGDCGNCDTACVTTGTNAQGNECLSGTCTPRCDATHANCDTQGPNGCEINTSADDANCGGCNMPCAAGRTCSGGTCVCTGGLTLCSGSCVNTTNNSTHCGACNNTCTGGRACVDSVCQCPAGQTFCAGVCVNMQTDPANCGICGRACQPTGTMSNLCVGGVCDARCNPLRGNCDMDPSDGCEESLASNNSNCGVCGRVCQFGAPAHVNPPTQAGNQCNASGACVPLCAQGYLDCNAEPGDGCEADVTTATRCGSCTNDCAGSACGSTGDTSCCIASGTQLQCQAQITLVNDVDAAAAAGTLSFTHALQAGTNRLILLAVAAETGGGGTAASRPDIVTYGGTPMIAGTEQSGGTTHWSPDLFFYYLTESGIGTKTGSQTVVVNGTPTTPNPGVPGVIIANLVEFSGVRQASPLGPYAGGTLPTDGDADTVVQTLAVATSGSRIYTLTAGMFCGGSALDPYLTAGPAPMTLLNNAGVSGSPADLRAAAAYVGSGSAAVLAGGPSVGYTLGWTYAFCGEITHEAVVVSPAP